jgi:thymidylate kinase
MKKGFLITVYGINNMGKSTHCKRLVERLEKEGHKAKYMKYPVYDVEPTGPFLDSVLRNPEGQKINEDELQMWFVMNRYQYQPELKRLLEEGYVVVAEDYIGTGIAWGITKGLDKHWLECANSHLLKSDFSIMIEGERVLKAREDVHVHEQNDELMKRCEKVHSDLADEYGWTRITLQKEKDDTAKLVWNAVDAFLKERYS